MSSVDWRAAADAAGGGRPPEVTRTPRAVSVLRAFLRDFLTPLDDERAPAGRLRMAAWVRLLFIVPFVLVPTALALVAAAPTGFDPVTSERLIRVWFATGLVAIAINIAILRLGTGATRARAVRLLTYLTLAAELLTNQLSMHALGTLTSHGALYTGVIVAVYRVFFDYRIGLFAAAFGSAVYVASAVLGFTGIVPASPILPAFEHVLHTDAILVGVVAYAVVMAFFFTFCAVNFAVNQSTKLHHYMTESVLRRYLPPSLVARAARGELKLDAEPERRVITVMFTDLVGFTSMSEQIGERDVARVLNRYLSECAAVAHHYGATIDKFIGDAVMVLVGAPDDLPPKEQARRCVAIARDMQAALADSPLQMRAGINTGEVIVGHFGSQVRSDFTAVGHAVNMAARLETACEPGRVLVGEATARLLDGAIELEPAGEFQLKGISKPVPAYYVVDAEPPS